MRVEALKRHPYGNRTYEVGESYEMDDKFVSAMTTTGNVRVVEAGKLNTRDMQADKPAKTYKTRDLKSTR